MRAQLDDVDLEQTIGQLKEDIMPIVAPGAEFSIAAPGAEFSTSIMLFFDGMELDDALSLMKIGITGSSTARLVMVIHDPLAMARAEINALHAEALNRSRREAAAARKIRREMIDQRKQEQEAAYVADRLKETGPLLMLTEGPASDLLPPSTSSEETSSLKVVPHALSVLKPHGGGESSELDDAPLASTQVRNTRSPRHLEEDATISAGAKSIVAAYEEFFNHIGFRKGWKVPPFSREEVGAAFLAAALVVARARVLVLDPRDPGIKIRQVEGSARDWMHSPECAVLLREDPDSFIAGLVHATFKDGKGYVEGITEQEVGNFLELYL